MVINCLSVIVMLCSVTTEMKANIIYIIGDEIWQLAKMARFIYATISSMHGKIEGFPCIFMIEKKTWGNTLTSHEVWKIKRKSTGFSWLYKFSFIQIYSDLCKSFIQKPTSRFMYNSPSELISSPFQNCPESRTWSRLVLLLWHGGPHGASQLEWIMGNSLPSGFEGNTNPHSPPPPSFKCCV